MVTRGDWKPVSKKRLSELLMSTQLKMMAAQQAGKEASKKAQAGVGALTVFVRENNWSIRGLSFIGSLAMLVLSVLKILNFFGVLTDIFGYIINVYSFIFAFAMFMIEAKDDWPLVEVCFHSGKVHV